MTKEEREWAIKSFTYVKTNAEAILRDLPLIAELISDEDILNRLSRKSAEEQIRRANAALEALKIEPCEDCVSRDAVLDTIYNTPLSTLSGALRDLPPVIPARKKGKWIKGDATYISQFYICSECGRRVELFDGNNLLDVFPYCHCGAEMEGEYW